jgi:hypothetical protein
MLDASCPSGSFESNILCLCPGRRPGSNDLDFRFVWFYELYELVPTLVSTFHGTLHIWWLLDLFSRWWLLLILASGLQSRSTVGGSKTKCPFGFRSLFSLISRRVGSLFFLRSWVPCCSKFQDVSRRNTPLRDAVRMSPVALRDFGCLHTAAPAIFSFHFLLSLSPQKQFCKHMFCNPTSACVLVKATADGIFWLKAIQCF